MVYAAYVEGYGVVDEMSQCERSSCDIEVPKTLFGLGFNNIRTLLIRIILLDFGFSFHVSCRLHEFYTNELACIVSAPRTPLPLPFHLTDLHLLLKVQLEPIGHNFIRSQHSMVVVIY